MYSGGRYCEKLLKFATDTPKTNNDRNPADATLPPLLFWDLLLLVDPLIFHLKTLIVPLPWVTAKTKFAEVVILSRVLLTCYLLIASLFPSAPDWKKNSVLVSMYLALLIINWILFLLLQLETGPPFHVVILATRKSSRLQCKGSTFISQLF